MPEPHRSASELRRDWVTGQQYVLASDRQNRPNEFQRPSDPPYGEACSFCAGYEHETTRTEASYPPPPTATHGCQWQVRVVENLYPIFSPIPVERAAAAPTSAVGQHFVIIESPTHRRQLTELSSDEIRTVFYAYRDQLRRLEHESGIESVLL
ncbi:MAG: hypothetical protein KDB23_25870, partial [Planctomycetales bacterium]|nr:hypothetical protein [Planctomycetales bacterium]